MTPTHREATVMNVTKVYVAGIGWVAARGNSIYRVSGK
ncbi:hypothetical protein SEA_STEAMY_91 [Mycobacterium phage Steamy]|uniref:Uncharacterized protein n=1 Tax=Mycobacterium phage Steamy TaxID=2250309 RepID=A0A345L0R3_9CAUD|nr:hypothetical protein KIV62_gp10 [Mycobacterium phage Steamy]AXH48865.1 hypothetical protein SEA_STEAMY_91 [Mycobacterium phage Steamy]